MWVFIFLPAFGWCCPSVIDSVITCTAMARMNHLHLKCFNKNLALYSNIWAKVLLCTQTFEQKSCFTPITVLQKSLCSSQTFWTKLLLCIQNVRKKSCFATKMVEQRSCFAYIGWTQVLLWTQNVWKRSCFAHNMFLNKGLALHLKF